MSTSSRKTAAGSISNSAKRAPGNRNFRNVTNFGNFLYKFPDGVTIMDVELMGTRLMAGQQTLNLYVEVRLLCAQLIYEKNTPCKEGVSCLKQRLLRKVLGHFLGHRNSTYPPISSSILAYAAPGKISLYESLLTRCGFGYTPIQCSHFRGSSDLSSPT